jgi:transcription factor CP2-like protein
VGHIEELSHNALAVYWNPLDSPAKVNLAVQCLSTDFSTQKGVKGLPLHVQIDTFDDPRADIMEQPTHRGYCQVRTLIIILFLCLNILLFLLLPSCFLLPLILPLQVKIFCDKGAERKLRDEERRAAKRRMTPSGKRRLDEMYHETFDRCVCGVFLCDKRSKPIRERLSPNMTQSEKSKTQKLINTMYKL